MWQEAIAQGKLIAQRCEQFLLQKTLAFERNQISHMTMLWPFVVCL